MSKNFEIVFVHLGSARAKHLWQNIQLILSLWPEHGVTLISDSQSNLKRADRLGVKTSEFILTKELSDLVSSSSHNPNFRSGFWNYSILRLFAVLDYSEKRPSTPLIHLESDIAVQSNFPFGILASLKKPSWMKFNESHDVGSIFTLPNSLAARELKSLFFHELSKNSGLTDMTLLSRIANAYPRVVNYLPVANKSDSKILREDIQGKQDGELLSNSFAVYGGVFDSAPIGMWLLGQDPRNHLGRILRFRNLPESFVQPQKVNYRFDLGTDTLFLDDNIPLFNLHVHSKETKYFDKKGTALKRRVRNSEALSRDSEFSFGAFHSLVLDYIKRKGLISIRNKLLKVLRI